MTRICVFCGSRFGNRPEYRESTIRFGQAMAKRDLELVYGGASVGLMGLLADAVLDGGGKVTGVIPKTLADQEKTHSGLHDLHLVSSMHERKALMESLSHGFVALPGGFGTLEETFEILTWAQLGLHGKPCGLLNTDGYYDELISFVKNMEHEGFLPSALDQQLLVDHIPESLLDRLSAKT